MKGEGSSDWLGALWARLDDMPASLRPPFYGMLAVYAIMLAKARFLWPILIIALIVAGPEGLLEGLWVLIVAGLAGFTGGTAFALVRPLTRRLGKPGAFITGWLSVFAYLSVALPTLSSDDPKHRNYFDTHDPKAWVITALMSIVFGSIVGAFLIDIAPQLKPKRRWLQRRQQVTSRSHPPAA
jgi:hypothetical protein